MQRWLARRKHEIQFYLSLYSQRWNVSLPSRFRYYLLYYRKVRHCTSLLGAGVGLVLQQSLVHGLMLEGIFYFLLRLEIQIRLSSLLLSVSGFCREGESIWLLSHMGSRHTMQFMILQSIINLYSKQMEKVSPIQNKNCCFLEVITFFIHLILL